MQEYKSKSIIEPIYNVLKERCAFLFGANKELLDERFSKINNIVVSDELAKSNPMSYRRTSRNIYINSFYANIDDKGNITSTIDDNDRFFKFCLTHELLHALSHHGSYVGFSNINGEINGTGLNEGVTQMFADDIVGEVENKYLGSYNELKIIAKIIRNTVGNNLLFKAYTEDEDLLKNALNSLNGSFSFYKELNEKLTAFNSLFSSTFIDKSSSTAKALFSEKFEKLLEYVVLNIVVPKAKTMDEISRRKYISKIIYDTSADDKAKNILMGIISKYIDLDSGKIEEAKENLKKENDKLDDSIKFVNLIDNGGNVNDKIYAKDNGEVYILSSNNKGRKVTSKQLLRYIYIKMFKAQNPNDIFSDEILDQYYKSIKAGKRLILNYDSVLKKRILFCAIVQALNIKRGILILNDFTELDNSNSIKPMFINTSLFDFDGLKTLASKYYVGKKGKYTYSMFDRRTRSEEENPTKKIYGFFANLWLDSVASRTTEGEIVEGITDAFSVDKRYMYVDIRNVVDKVMKEKQFFDTKTMLKRLHGEEKRIFKRLIATPTRFEWCYEFLRRESSFVVDDAYKGKSLAELENEEYMKSKSHDDMLDVISMK